MTERTSSSRSVADTTGYRPDIDGLRAFSVLAVIAFHINKDLMPGGFVGVDIFFVISGYLISAHIFSAAARGEFSFADFYFRRIRRIAPAMLVVLAVTLLTAQLVLLPDDAKAASKSAVWSLASLANVYFWLFQDAGYFAGSSNKLPLLHLWSLSVEEQFYLIWPIIAIAMCRLRVDTQLIGMALAIAAATAFAQLAFVDSPSFVYFMLPSRCAELLVGAILALAVDSGKTQVLAPRHAMPIALAGLAMVLASAILVSEHGIFPGLAALPPTIGAALIILGGGIGGNPVSRLLSVTLLRGIGIISYPAYLWHWPLLAFYRYGYGEPGALAGPVLFVVALLLAALTYRYVEQPAKRIRAIRRKGVYAGFAASSFTLAALGTAFVYADRVFPSLLESDYARQLAAARALNLSTVHADDVCLRKVLTAADLANTHCAIGSGARPAKRVLLMGDSNAAHYVGIISAFAERGEFRFRNLEVGSCPPVIGDVSPFVQARRLVACTASHQVWSSAIAEADVLILGGAWSSYVQASSSFLPMFQAQVRQYAAMGKTVLILGKVPPIPAYDGLCREKAIRYPLMQCKAPPNEMPEDIARINSQLRRFAESVPNVRYFDVEAIICPGGKCSAYGVNKAGLYFDQSHLSVQGSLEIGRRIHEATGMPHAFDFAGSSELVDASAR